MDPLSVAASIAGLLTLSEQITKAVVNYSKGVKNGPETIEGLIEELTALHSALERLAIFNSAGEHKSGTLGKSSVLLLALDKCEDILARLFDKVQTFNQNKISATFERLKWPFSEKEIRIMLTNLRGYVSTFQFSLTADGWMLLSQNTEAVLENLEIQKQTSFKVIEMTKSLGAFAMLTKEALTISTQLDHVVDFVKGINEKTESLYNLTEGVTILAVRAQESEKKDILDWLSPSPFDQKHHDVRAQRIEGTGGWLLESEAFKSWELGSNQVLCCLGGPGVGKSVLTSLVVDRLQHNLIAKNVAVTYFYFDYREHSLRTPAIFVASLLRQLAIQISPFPASLIDFYDEHKHEQAQRLNPQLTEVFEDVCRRVDKLYVVIDALDECAEARSRKAILEILRKLKSNAFHLFLTARPHTEKLQPYFQDVRTVEISANKNDLQTYCVNMINSSDSTRELMNEELKKEIIETIVAKADGMFLLPTLQMQAITDALTKSEIRKVLRNLTSDLGQTFQNVMQRIYGLPQNRRQIALNTLMWTSHARRPLLITELVHALATNIGDIEFDEDGVLQPANILENCLGLIVVDQESSTVRLVHYAFQEYLQSHGTILSTTQEEETYITNILLTYLCLNGNSGASRSKDSQDSPDEVPKIAPLMPSFLEYAAIQWGRHASKASMLEIQPFALRFLRNLSLIERAVQNRLSRFGLPERAVACQIAPPQTGGHGRLPDKPSTNTSFESRKTGLHLAAQFGLSDLVKFLIEDGASIDAADIDGNQPLHEAVSKGHIDTVQVLLDKGAKVNVKNADNSTPLYLATTRSNTPITKILLEAGANPNTECLDGWSPLHKAADNGHVEIAKLLLDYDASVIRSSARGLKPLHRAAGRGHLDLMRILLAAKTPVDIFTSDKWTSLHGASSAGQTEAVCLLIDHGAKVNKPSSDGQTPLHRAAREGHSNTVAALLDRGADPLCQANWGEISLHRAAKGGHRAVVELLLHRNERLAPTTPAQLTTRKNTGETPRDEARLAGHWSLVVELQRQEALLTGSTLEFSSDLERAVVENNVARVAALLSSGAAANEQNQDGLTPLHVALLLDHTAAAESLLRHHDTDLAVQTGDGWQPLHCAAKAGSEHFVQMCLDRGADIAAVTKDGRTALHMSCMSASVDTVRLLVVEWHADIEAVDNFGWRPLHRAAAAGSKEIIKLLVERGVNTMATTHSKMVAQACASRRGHYAVVEYLRNLRYEGANNLQYKAVSPTEG